MTKQLTIDSLPDEVLFMIFDWLPHYQVIFVCSFVCTRWCAVVQQGWLVIQARGYTGLLQSRLRALHVGASTQLASNILIGITGRTPYLRYLTVHAGAPFTGDQIAALAVLPNLYHLDVFSQQRLLDARALPVLRRLGSFVANETISPRLLCSLAKNHKFSLNALHMFGRARHYPRRDLVSLLRVGADRLRELTLRCHELNDQTYAAIGSCVKLESLQLYSCWLMRSAGAQSVSSLPHLRRLHITGARMLRSNSLGTVIELFPGGIEELVLSTMWFGDEHVDALVKHVKGLRMVEFWRCHLSVNGVLKLAAQLPQLRVLDIDLVLTIGHLRQLSLHPTLEKVRCQFGNSNGPFTLSVRHELAPNKLLQVLSIDAPFRDKLFRDEGEGFQGSLFYHWTQHLELDIPQFR